MLSFKNKKVLVMGLGILGGGIATTKWLVRHGAQVTVTDLSSRQELQQSIRGLGRAARKIRFALGQHREADFKNNEIIIVNPAVPRESKFLAIAKKHGARLENEASIFFRFCKNQIIAVTGTRGKTTTASWTHHFLKSKYPRAVLTGNSSANPMLKALDKLDGKSPVVIELSSWHLELLPQSKRAPHIAVITNIYPDHLNRYRGMRDYARAKANIFKNQTERDFLILNKNNKWTEFFRRLHAGWRVKSRLIFFSEKFHYPHDRKGNEIGRIRQKFLSLGKHNLENLDCATRVAALAGVSPKIIRSSFFNLPQVKFREEVVWRRKNLIIINDSTATSPDASIAALERFASSNLILVAGGTDKNLIFSEWAKTIKKHVKPRNLYLLQGSATKKMIGELNKVDYFSKNKPQLFESLLSILSSVKNSLKAKSYKLKAIVLFSPGAASFEKFANEFDRGEKFNLYAKKFLRGF